MKINKIVTIDGWRAESPLLPKMATGGFSYTEHTKSKKYEWKDLNVPKARNMNR